MNRKLLLATSLFLMAMTAWSQEFKVGYTSIDAIVFSMPEIPQINADLQVYQKQLASQVESKQKTIDAKIAEYQKLAQQPTVSPTVMQEKETEIRKLQADFANFSQKADESLSNKSNNLFNPIYVKVQNAIEEVRKEKGYGMILNAGTDTGGIVLAAREEDNITKAVFEKLGVPMPVAPEGGAPAAKSGGN
ncbi:OmpH family outer membrane protein [Roseivirga seohaensis]|nr:OmpH family outer membrane protein [Roseivirga seohaensis]|tara:strand:+ start:122 stop:694 length:573 start_codon:yes stop_codon:yes gene_type:complete